MALSSGSIVVITFLKGHDFNSCKEAELQSFRGAEDVYIWLTTAYDDIGDIYVVAARVFEQIIDG